MKILFQGDSITDAGRNKDEKSPFATFGQGYVNLIVGRLGYEAPADYLFYNRGVSGDRVVDLYARWRKDCIKLCPDLVSLYVGVNDCLHEFNKEPNGVPVGRFEMILRMLIEETLEELPGVRFMMLEPFLVPGSGIVEENYDKLKADVVAHAAVVKNVAAEFDIPLIPLQKIFDDALKLATARYWVMDGVHPTTAGHGLIAKNWLETFHKYFD